jgi:O-antigen/teichoic acid export membrane protein
MVILRWYFSPWKPTFDFNFAPIKSMIGFSSKLFFTNIFNQISNNLLSVLIGKSYGERQTGLYSQGYKWMILGNTIIHGMINSVAQPVLVETNEDKNRQLQVFRKMIRFGAFVSFPAMFGLAFIAREFILVTIGEKWLGSVLFLQLFCICSGLGYIGNLYYQLLLSHGKSKIIMRYSITVSLIMLTAVLLTSGYGIFVMLIAYLSVYLLSMTGWHCYAGNQIDLKAIHVLKDILPYLLITLSCLFVAWLLTLPVQNIYILCISKIITVFVLYILIMKLSRSVIFKESINFFTNHKKT